MVKKDILIREVDISVYRRAKAVAASKGITMGNAVDQALTNWTNGMEGAAGIQAEVDRNREFVQSNWKKIYNEHKGKAVVVSKERLQGVFSTYEEHALLQ